MPDCHCARHCECWDAGAFLAEDIPGVVTVAYGDDIDTPRPDASLVYWVSAQTTEKPMNALVGDLVFNRDY